MFLSRNKKTEILFVEKKNALSRAMKCVLIEDLDQLAHPGRLIRVCCLSEDHLDPWLPTWCPANTDQTVQMCSLI